MTSSPRRTSNVAEPTIYFSAGIPLAARLHGIHPDWRGQQWRPGAEIRSSPHVLLLTVADAQAALARGVAAPIILWAPQDQGRLVHPRVVGALDAGSADETVRIVLTVALARSDAGSDRAGQMLERVLEVGRALASEKD